MSLYVDMGSRGFEDRKGAFELRSSSDDWDEGRTRQAVIQVGDPHHTRVILSHGSTVRSPLQ